MSANPIVPMFGKNIPAFPILQIYRDQAPVGAIERGGRRIEIRILVEGWWCEGLRFGIAEWNTGYETLQSAAEGSPEEAAEIQQVVREAISTVPEEVAAGRHYYTVDTTGGFMNELMEFRKDATQRIAEWIDRYNTPNVSIDTLLAGGGDAGDETDVMKGPGL